MLAEYNLAGKVALVTGAGRGIGTGIAEVLAEAGASVVINALTPRFAEGIARSIGEKTGGRVVAMTADVTDESAVAGLADRVLSDFGQIDILVNNLGDAIPGLLVPLPDRPDRPAVTESQLKLVIDLNLMAAIHCTRAFGPGMLERRRGKVINIASFAALRGQANLSGYATGKTALLGLTRSLALEWASYGIQVNAIAPGFFPDPVTAGAEGYAKTCRDCETRVPAGREGRLREVGLLALYLASPASDYMTGQVLSLDGGLTV